MSLRVAVVHERFTDYAGSERVVEQLVRLWPQADVFVPVADRAALPPGVDSSRVRTAGSRPSTAAGAATRTCSRCCPGPWPPSTCAATTSWSRATTPSPSVSGRRPTCRSCRTPTARPAGCGSRACAPARRGGSARPGSRPSRPPSAARTAARPSGRRRRRELLRRGRPGAALVGPVGRGRAAPRRGRPLPARRRRRARGLLPARRSARPVQAAGGRRRGRTAGRGPARGRGRRALGRTGPPRGGLSRDHARTRQRRRPARPVPPLPCPAHAG